MCCLYNLGLSSQGDGSFVTKLLTCLSFLVWCKCQFKIWGAMQPLNANFPYEKAAALFDQYIDDGNSLEDLLLETNGLFESWGFFRKGQE